jgi:hypothetical protein
MGDWISQPVTHFHGRVLPEPGSPAGYAALLERFDLAVPTPPRLAAIAGRHPPRQHPAWRLLTPRHRPEDTREKELAALTDAEAERLERLYTELFVGNQEQVSP